jgi:peptidoglycan hydrolase-like protein with peptidoglycan-binding domain
MRRILFAKGVKGEIVRKIQQRLTDLGFDPVGVDGDYGDNTRNAVIAFQQANSGLEATGEVDVTTYERLLGPPIPSVEERSLQLTAAFEGHSFTLAEGNFDGAGITWGIIGFTLAHGEVKKIILEINDRNPSLVREAFEDKTDQLLDVLQSPLSEQLAFASSISVGSNRALAEPWRSSFRRFGEREEVQAVQIRIADQDFFQPALRTARELGLKTELGIALAFDCHVQDGGVKHSARQQINQELAGHPVGSEQELRVIIANAVADKARPKFREDVSSRKLTIANGSGRVHGATFVLRSWGLDEFPFPG